MKTEDVIDIYKKHHCPHHYTIKELFELYKDCIYQGMLKDRQKRGLPPPKPESALGDLLEWVMRGYIIYYCNNKNFAK